MAKLGAEARNGAVARNWQALRALYWRIVRLVCLGSALVMMGGIAYALRWAIGLF
jgi:hypothetical protein